jgi:dolichol-phosphate mannosyltransferase
LLLTIVLPIFNESANLPDLFGRIEASFGASAAYRIIAVDDGSSDGSAEILAGFGAKLPLTTISHGVNQGLGMAIRTGLTEALRTSPPDGIVVTMDADESHTPSLIGAMERRIAEGADVVIASRFEPGAEVHGVPFGRRILSWGASMFFRVLFPTPGVKDFTCGYRAYRAQALQKAADKYGEKLFEFEGFQCMVDLLLKLRASGARFAEVPVILRYDLKRGASKMRVTRTVARTLDARRLIGR